MLGIEYFGNLEHYCFAKHLGSVTSLRDIAGNFM